MNRPAANSFILSDLIDIKHGFAFQSEFFGDVGEYLLLTPGNFDEAGGFRDLGDLQKRYSGPVPTDFILNEGDILVAMTEQSPGLLGSTIRIPVGNIYLHNQRLGLVHIKRPDNIDKGYLYHLFNAAHIRKEITTASSGTKVKHTSPSKMCSIKVQLPSLSEQKTTAAILDTWDVAIGNMERLIVEKTNHNIYFGCQLLFGKMRFGGRKTKGVFAKPWFSVPNDWRIVPIGTTAKEVSMKNQDSGDIPVLSCTKYQGLVDSLKYFDKQIFSKDTSTYKIAEYGQFAYATNHIEEGSIGYQNLYPKGLVSPMYTVFKTDRQLVNDGYLYKLLKTETYRHIFQVNTSASVDRRGSLRWGQFSKLPIPLPSLDEQEEIIVALENAQKEIDLLTRKVELLKKQKRGLMLKLLSGEWRVKAAGEVS